jgi:hypothetical protein
MNLPPGTGTIDDDNEDDYSITPDGQLVYISAQSLRNQSDDIAA